MRITPNDVSKLTESYIAVKESLGLGYGVPSQINVTSIGSEGPKIPRSPIAALKGEVPGGEGAQSNEEYGDMVADDTEEDMAIAALGGLASKASELKDILQQGEQLEPWVFTKIVLATDYITAVLDYINSKHVGGSESERLTDTWS